MVKSLVEKGMSERQACKLSRINRCSYRYESQVQEDDTREVLRGLAIEHKCYGSPRLTVLLKKTKIINHKKIERIYREEKLQLPRRKPRKRHLGAAFKRPCTATSVNEVWSLDFVFDRALTQQKLKFLTVVD